jgi:hypothetical protein
MSSETLLRLPAELKKDILGYITSYTDLTSLCQTCRELRSLTLPALYRVIVLSVANINDHLRKSLSKSNAGLRHTRVLRVQDDRDCIGIYDHDQQGLRLEYLLRCLPRHRMEIVDIDTRAHVPS